MIVAICREMTGREISCYRKINAETLDSPLNALQKWEIPEVVALRENDAKILQEHLSFYSRTKVTSPDSCLAIQVSEFGESVCVCELVNQKLKMFERLLSGTFVYIIAKFIFNYEIFLG